MEHWNIWRKVDEVDGDKEEMIEENENKNENGNGLIFDLGIDCYEWWGSKPIIHLAL